MYTGVGNAACKPKPGAHAPSKRLPLRSTHPWEDGPGEQPLQALEADLVQLGKRSGTAGCRSGSESPPHLHSLSPGPEASLPRIKRCGQRRGVGSSKRVAQSRDPGKLPRIVLRGVH